MNWKKDNQFLYQWESNDNNLVLTKLMKFVLLFICMISGNYDTALVIHHLEHVFVILMQVLAIGD